MKTAEKKVVEVSKTETPVNVKIDNQSLLIVKKKLTIEEKLDKITSFDAIHGKYEYLKECKLNLEKFDKSKNDYSNAKIVLKESYNTELTVSNPIVIQEMVKIARMRITEQIIIVEKEIELVYVLYIGGFFNRFIKGSVIPFITIDDCKDIIRQHSQFLNNTALFEKIHLIETLKETTRQKLVLIEQMQRALCFEAVKVK